MRMKVILLGLFAKGEVNNCDGFKQLKRPNDMSSAFVAVDSGLITRRVKLITFKVIASLLDTRHQRQCGEQAGKFTCCDLGKRA